MPAGRTTRDDIPMGATAAPFRYIGSPRERRWAYPSAARPPERSSGRAELASIRLPQDLELERDARRLWGCRALMAHYGID
jgi:hypothetical protein